MTPPLKLHPQLSKPPKKSKSPEKSPKKLERALVEEAVVSLNKLSEISEAPIWTRPKLIVREYFRVFGHENKARNGKLFELAISTNLIAGGVPNNKLQANIQIKPANAFALSRYGRSRGWEIDIFRAPTEYRPAVVVGCKISGRERIKQDYALAYYISMTWGHMELFNGQKPKLYIIDRQEHQGREEDLDAARKWNEGTHFWLTLGDTPVSLITVLDDDAMKTFFEDCGVDCSRHFNGARLELHG